MNGKVLRVRKFKAGYEYRDVEVDQAEYGGKGALIMKRQAFNSKGEYIGGPNEVKHLIKIRGIVPEKSKKEHCVCSIGYSKRRKMYYGWSHRAICGFKIGDKIFEDRYGNDKTKFHQHGRKTIRTIGDAKLSAKRFANHVS